MRQLKITQRITSRHETSLDKYLSDISKYSPLSVEEETDLFKQIEVLNPNDKEDEEKILKIKDKIIKANLRFVVSVAKNEMVSGMQLQDLINEWNIWLAKAVDRFDYKRWFKLISYAVWWIRQAIKQYINENTSVIRHPMNQEGLRKKVQKFISEFQQKYNYSPTKKEIMDGLWLSDKEYNNYTDTKSSTIIESFDSPLMRDEEDTLYDVVEDQYAKRPDVDILLESERQCILYKLKQLLTSKEFNVVTELSGILTGKEKTLQEVADKFDYSRERVRQIRDKSYKKLKKDRELYILFQSYNE